MLLMNHLLPKYDNVEEHDIIIKSLIFKNSPRGEYFYMYNLNVRIILN